MCTYRKSKHSWLSFLLFKTTMNSSWFTSSKTKHQIKCEMMFYKKIPQNIWWRKFLCPVKYFQVYIIIHYKYRKYDFYCCVLDNSIRETSFKNVNHSGFLHGEIFSDLQWQPTPVLLPEESHGRRSLVGYSPWGCKESDTTERLYLLILLPSDEGRESKLLQKALEIRLKVLKVWCADPQRSLRPFKRVFQITRSS